jgi:hypothetical protein
MASQTFKRQIDRIKADLDVFNPKPVTVLTEPGPDAEPAAVAHYREQLALARHSKNGGLVVIAFPRPSHAAREQVRGVQFVDSEFEATLLRLAGQPSEHGGKNGLDDFLKSLSGNVLGVTANVPADIYQRSATLDQ